VELNDLVKGKPLFLDTAPLIYFIRKNRHYLDIIRPVIFQIDGLETEGISLTITLLEVLVHPLRNGNKKPANKIQGHIAVLQRSGDLRDFTRHI